MSNRMDYANAEAIFTEVGNKRQESQNGSTALTKATVGWTGKNLGEYVNRPLAGNEDIGFSLGAAGNGSSIVAQIDHNTSYIFSKKNEVGNRFRVVLFYNNPLTLTEPDLTASQLIFEAVTSHDPYQFNSGNYNYAVCTFGNSEAVVSQDEAEAMLHPASITDSTYEPYHPSVEEVVGDIRAEQAVLGAKNLLSLKSATKNPSTTLTVVFNNNGSITLNGTQESAASLVVLSARGDANATRLKGEKDYILSIENPSMYVYMQVGYTSPSDSSFVLVAQSDYGESELNFRCPIEADNQPWTMQILCRSGFNPSDYIIYPMLRLATDPDDTYVPYAMTNRELTEKLTVQESAVTDIISGATVYDNINYLNKSGNVVQLNIALKEIAAERFNVVAKIPNGYKPKRSTRLLDTNANKQFIVEPSGNIITAQVLNSSTDIYFLSATWITP